MLGFSSFTTYKEQHIFLLGRIQSKSNWRPAVQWSFPQGAVFYAVSSTLKFYLTPEKLIFYTTESACWRAEWLAEKSKSSQILKFNSAKSESKLKHSGAFSLSLSSCDGFEGITKSTQNLTAFIATDRPFIQEKFIHHHRHDLCDILFYYNLFGK